MKATGWLVVAAVVVAGTWQAVESRAALEIRTLSSRPDLVSGGDTLVAIKAPAGTPVGSAERDAERQGRHGALHARCRKR